MNGGNHRRCPQSFHCQRPNGSARGLEREDEHGHANGIARVRRAWRWGTAARRHGGTVAIGGIYSTDEREDVTRVPLLGKIPVLGWLFRHTARRNPRSERVIFITPHIVPARL